MMPEKKPRPKSVGSARDKALPGMSPASAAPIQSGETKWHEQAAFHITFEHVTDPAGQAIRRTRALHEETGEEHNWEGIPGPELTLWMHERAGLHGQEPALEPSAEARPEQSSAETRSGDLESDLWMQISALEVEEVWAEKQVGGLSVRGDMRSRLSFELSGPRAYLATANLGRYAVQLMAHDLATNQGYLLATSQRELRAEGLCYTEVLDFDCPPLGSYQLLANVVLTESGLAAVALGPVLTVVP
jgi:hypothetical protein